MMNMRDVSFTCRVFLNKPVSIYICLASLIIVNGLFISTVTYDCRLAFGAPYEYVKGKVTVTSVVSQIKDPLDFKA